MKKLALVMVAAMTMSTAAPLLAQDETNQDRVICNLASKNCLTQSEAIQKRIKKIRSEMAKGKTYSTEDVKQLEQKLKEAQEILDRLEGKTPKK